MTNPYAILCPECGEHLTDVNRVSSTVLDAFEDMPGGKAYRYVYQCPACDVRITWTQWVSKTEVHTHFLKTGEEDS